MKIYSYNNHPYDNNIIDKLTYTSDNIIMHNNIYYLSLYIPSYNDDIDIDNLYIYYLNDITYKDIYIPKLTIYKYIYIYEKNNISLITTHNIQYNNIYDFINECINYTTNSLEVLHNVLLKITNSTSFYLYLNISVLDKLSSHILYFDNFINKLLLILNTLETKNEKNINSTRKVNIIKERINSIKFYHDSIKTTSIQKITYQETKVTKVFTYVATIFLPLSFIIAVFSLPVKNIPFRNNEYALYFIILILIIVSVISSYYLVNLEKKNIFDNID